ncbi:hypothetical protein KP79_PYT19475 [Mizuhopecten yessoensis]|uniref:LRAT domain-containing protein n=1 Tax=Mizuhopecten yessoensis TaxID=6573 RepID=A0A210QL48_MIZYE|nr:hypothetical protein KP79_PYT19475 [Mizuhopecten yessoensis]
MRPKSFRCDESTRRRKERVDCQLRGLRTGDLIGIEQTLFVHFVVYMGDGTIVGNVKSGVVYQNLYEKVGRNDCYICNYLDDMYRHFPPSVITDRAKRFATEKEFSYSMIGLHELAGSSLPFLRAVITLMHNHPIPYQPRPPDQPEGSEARELTWVEWLGGIMHGQGIQWCVAAREQ